jgi:hypothetical protein
MSKGRKESDFPCLVLACDGWVLWSNWKFWRFMTCEGFRTRDFVGFLLLWFKWRERVGDGRVLLILSCLEAAW